MRRRLRAEPAAQAGRVAPRRLAGGGQRGILQPRPAQRGGAFGAGVARERGIVLDGGGMAITASKWRPL
jgi:hypothetical protein